MGKDRRTKVHAAWLKRACCALLVAVSTLHAEEPATPQNRQLSAGNPPQSWVESDWSQEPACEECEACTAGRHGWLSHRLPLFRQRNMGLGEPLRTTSWLNRANYAGTFFGSTMGGDLGPDFDLEPSLYTGIWLGRDFSHYWGAEINFGLNYGDITYQPASYVATDSRNTMAGSHVLYYPWGDARWRPYASLGVGVASYHFQDELGYDVNHTALMMPIGLGVKFLAGPRWAIRLDIKDNVTFGGHGMNTIGNWSVLTGFEFHWGAASVGDYYPW